MTAVWASVGAVAGMAIVAAVGVVLYRRRRAAGAAAAAAAAATEEGFNWEDRNKLPALPPTLAFSGVADEHGKAVAETPSASGASEETA